MRKQLLPFLVALLLFPVSSSALSPAPTNWTKITDDFNLEAIVNDENIQLDWSEIAYDPDSLNYNETIHGGYYDPDLKDVIPADIEKISNTYYLLSSPALTSDQNAFEDGESSIEPYKNWKLIGYGEGVVSQIDNYPFHEKTYYAVCQGHELHGIACSRPLEVLYTGGDHTVTGNLSLESSLNDESIVLNWNEYGQQSNDYHYKLIRYYNFNESAYNQDKFYFFNHYQNDLHFAGDSFSYQEKIPTKNTAYAVCTHNGISDECSEPLVINPQGGEIIKTPELNLQAVASNGKIKLSWSNYKPEGFNAYRVLYKELEGESWNGDESSLELVHLSQLTAYETEVSSWNGSATERNFVYQVCANAYPESFCSEPQIVNYNGSNLTILPNIQIAHSIKEQGEINFIWADFGVLGIQRYDLLRYPASDHDESLDTEQILKNAIEEYGFYEFPRALDNSVSYGPFPLQWDGYVPSQQALVEKENSIHNQGSVYFAVCAYTDLDEYYCSAPERIDQEVQTYSNFNVTLVDALKMYGEVDENGDINFEWNEYRPNNFEEYRLISVPLSSYDLNKTFLLEGFISNVLKNEGYDKSFNEEKGSISQLNASGYFLFSICAHANDHYYCGSPKNLFLHPQVSDSLKLEFKRINSNLNFSWEDLENRENGHYVMFGYSSFERFYLGGGGWSWSESLVNFDESTITIKPINGVNDYMVCYIGETQGDLDVLSFQKPSEFEECSKPITIGHFPDTTYHPYREEIEDLQISRIVYGHDETGLYGADDPIDRAAFSAIVMRHLHGPEMDFKGNELKNCKPDVQDQWFSSPLCLAIEKQIMAGYPDGFVRPEKNIQLDEAAKILTNAYGLTPGSEGINWYDQYISAIEPFAPNIAKKNPTHLITRGEMAKMIWEIKKHDDAYWDHYHTNESYNGNLYLIKRNDQGQYEGENWIDELWKYDLDKKATKTYSAKGLDFRVAPRESYIAVTWHDSDAGEDVLSVLDSEGEILVNFSLDDLSLRTDGDILINLLSWNDEGDRFWGMTSGAGEPMNFFSIEVDSWEVTKYSIDDLKVGSEFDLNPNTGMLAYSDLPLMFGVDDMEIFEANQNPVQLLVHDLTGTDAQIYVVDQSVAKVFEPRWIDEERLKYNDPDGNERIVKIIDLQELEVYQSGSENNPPQNVTDEDRILITRDNIESFRAELPTTCDVEGISTLHFLSREETQWQSAVNPTTDLSIYSSSEKGLEISIPYNPIWGSPEYRLNPYDEYDNGISFGTIFMAGEGCGTWTVENRLDFKEVQSKEEILIQLQQESDAQELSYTINELLVDGKEIIEYWKEGVCGGGSTIIIGQKYNYEFYRPCGPLTDEELIKSIKFID